jgi:peptidoglycan/LPS O-acetylase OafA/YrhL
MQIAFGAGRSGVTFFFVLSGFVLAWSARPSDDARGFYRRRFARIYPAYVVALALGAAALALSEGAGHVRDAWLTPVLLQAWVPNSDWYFAALVPAWSLSCEAFFSLVFPPVRRRLAHGSTRTLAWVGTACVGMPVALALTAMAWGGVGGASLSDNSVWVWLTVYCPLTRLPEFVLGMALALALRRGALPRVGLLPAAGASAAVVLACGAVPSVLGVVALPLVPFALLIVAAAQSDLRASSRSVLRHRLLVGLGGISYCFYLVHHVFVARLLEPGIGGLGGWAAFALALAGALVTAWVLHVLVERPLERRLRGPWRATSAAPSDTSRLRPSARRSGRPGPPRSSRT